MEKIYKGVSIYQVKTNKIDELSQIVCVNLDVGDIVIELKDGEELAYLVSSKTSEKMVLTSNSNGSIIEIVYEMNDEGKWAYNKTDVSVVGDIISQIKVTYEEDSDITRFLFPKGIIPLNFVINETYYLYFLDYKLVDSEKQNYQEFDVTDCGLDDGCFSLYLNGNRTELVITGLNYVVFENDCDIFANSYYLFYPLTSSKVATRYETNNGIDELPSDFVASLHQGDVIVIGESTYIVTYILDGSDFTFTEIGSDYIDNFTYGYEDGEWVYQGAVHFDLASFSKVWNLSDFFGDDISEVDVTGMKIGDIIIDGSNIMTAIVHGISFDGDNHIASISGYGIGDGSKSFYFDYNNENWSIDYIATGTKLYKHTITIAPYTNIEIISTSSNSITRLDSSAFETALKIEWKAGGEYSGYQIYNYEVKYTGGGSYDGFVLYFVKSTNDGTNVTNTYKFYSHDNSNVTDNVTPL